MSKRELIYRHDWGMSSYCNVYKIDDPVYKYEVEGHGGHSLHVEANAFCQTWAEVQRYLDAYSYGVATDEDMW